MDVSNWWLLCMPAAKAPIVANIGADHLLSWHPRKWPTLIYIGHGYGWVVEYRLESGDMEDGITFGYVYVPIFPLYIAKISAWYKWCRHRFYDLYISLNWGLSFPMCGICRMVTVEHFPWVVRVMGLYNYVCQTLIDYYLSSTSIPFRCAGTCSQGGLCKKRGIM